MFLNLFRRTLSGERKNRPFETTSQWAQIYRFADLEILLISCRLVFLKNKLSFVIRNPCLQA